MPITLMPVAISVKVQKVTGSICSTFSMISSSTLLPSISWLKSIQNAKTVIQALRAVKIRVRAVLPLGIRKPTTARMAMPRICR